MCKINLDGIEDGFAEQDDDNMDGCKKVEDDNNMDGCEEVDDENVDKVVADDNDDAKVFANEDNDNSIRGIKRDLDGGLSSRFLGPSVTIASLEWSASFVKTLSFVIRAWRVVCMFLGFLKEELAFDGGDKALDMSLLSC